MKNYIHNLSLRGITGILIGVYSLIYIYYIDFFINQFSTASEGVSLLPISFFEILLIVLSIFFILISYITILLVNRKRRRKIGLKGWDISAKRIRNFFFILLVVGGICLYVLMNQGLLKFIIPCSLLFYGIFCIAVNNYTAGSSKFLGLFFIIQGVLSIISPALMFLFWGIAFGCFHIIYGLLYHFKKDYFPST